MKQKRREQSKSLTTAERQALFRERHLASGDSVELRAVLTRDVAAKLERLVGYHDTTKRGLLMRLIEDAEQRTWRRLRGKARRAYENGDKR